MKKPLIAVFSRDTRMICDLPARGKSWFRFAVCEAIDEVEEFFSLNRAAALVADFRAEACCEGPEASWLNSIRQRFEELRIVVVASTDVLQAVDRADNVALLCCNDGRNPTAELLSRLNETAI